jgi:hypothetical protein
MIGFLLDDLREWRSAQMSRVIALSSLLVALVGALSMLQPMLMAMSVSAVSLCLGWSCGSTYRMASSARRLLIYCPLRAGSVVAGKVLSSLVIWSVVMVVLSPPLLVTAVVRGLDFDAAAACALSWLVTFYFSLSLSLLVCIGFARSDGLAGFFLLAFWIGSSIFAEPIRHSNPFVQVYDLMKAGRDVADWVWMSAAAFSGTIFVYGSAAALDRIRKMIHV